jgi:hypothetical protein
LETQAHDIELEGTYNDQIRNSMNKQT